MFKEEARWIQSALSGAPIKSESKILEVGASNLEYRTVLQPHIHDFIHKPLLERGCDITFLDRKKDKGVDIELDLCSNSLPDSLFKNTYDLIICCNILEHVIDRGLFINNLLRFSHPGTLLMITVPRVFEKHNDPIDTMYRPTVKELNDFIHSYKNCKVIKSDTLVIADKTYYIRKAGRRLDYVLMRPQRLLARWYVKPWRWKVTCVLLARQG